jgi:hypothetical protein
MWEEEAVQSMFHRSSIGNSDVPNILWSDSLTGNWAPIPVSVLKPKAPPGASGRYQYAGPTYSYGPAIFVPEDPDIVLSISLAEIR